jgi:hypothetical protein
VDSLPTEVDDSETIVRVIKSPFHTTGSKKALRKQAFHPPRGGKEVSVIRQMMTDDFCKNKAVEIIEEERARGGSPQPAYQGLAAGSVGFVRGLDATVDDYPTDFIGHAHVSLPEAAETEEPPSPQVLAALDQYYTQMVEHFCFYKDPAPDVQNWSGPSLFVA